KERPLENTPIKTATTEDKSMIGTIGFLAKAPQRIITNGSNINIFQLKIELSSAVNPPTLSPEVLSGSKPRPTTNHTIIPTIVAGIVVHNICFKCSYMSTPTTRKARLDVSYNGDSLSQKIASEIIAPAVIPKGRFISTAIPIKATPAVADEPQAVPVATETIAVIIKAVTKKYLGSMIKSP